MKRLLAIALCIALPTYVFAASDGGYKVAYDGGSITDAKPGNDLKLYMENNQIRFVKDKKDLSNHTGRLSY